MIGVNIVDFVIFPDLRPVHTTFHLIRRSDEATILTDHLAIHFLELPKLQPEFQAHLQDKPLQTDMDNNFSTTNCVKSTRTASKRNVTGVPRSSTHGNRDSPRVTGRASSKALKKDVKRECGKV